MKYQPGPSAAQVAAEKAAQLAARSKKFIFQPVLIDYSSNSPMARGALAPGDIVVKVQPYGCPRNGTMGQCYVGHPVTGEFIGMVAVNSLSPAPKGALA